MAFESEKAASTSLSHRRHVDVDVATINQCFEYSAEPCIYVCIGPFLLESLESSGIRKFQSSWCII